MKIDIFNTDKKYSVIYADPPWRYKDRKCNGACEFHYKTMDLESLEKLPVKNLAERDAVLFLWATYPQMKEALQLIEEWGFKYKTIAFQWIKLNRNVQLNNFTISTVQDILHKACFFGLGRWTRGNTECCLLATKGKPRRNNNSVSQLVFSPLTRHSAKPPEVREKIKRLMGECNSIELFAREYAAGWDCWGNEV
jgi:hypothetical protein|nr:MAG TPA: N6 adenosine methyltransferase subunit [Caudoviricetes sp.]